MAVNTTLKHLHLDNNHTIKRLGWHGFLDCLWNSHSAMESLSLSDCKISTEVAVAAVLALANNATVKKLDLSINPYITSSAGTVVALVLCNKTSVESTFSSNHTLVKLVGSLSEDSDDWYDITSSLKMNENADKSEVAREKILKHHFPMDRTGIQEFARMSETIMPNAIEWTGRNRLSRLSLMYELARGLPTLFEVRREIHARAGEKKRKR